MTTLAFSRSGDSVCSSSSPKQQRRVTKRFNRALFDEIDVPVKENRVTFAAPDHDIPKQARQPQAYTQIEEADDSFGFGCGGRLNESYGFGCGGGGGGLRTIKDTTSLQDPFGVVGRVRAMIQEKFSSRIDFSPSENRRVNVNFVEHRM